jgi:hypothetical protein
VLESPEIGIIGVGEGTFPTIRNTLRYIGIDEARFVRATSATFKQGIRFDNWVRAPVAGRDDHFLHPFEARSTTRATASSRTGCCRTSARGRRSPRR